MMTVTVTDRQRNYVMGLTREAFIVTDEGTGRPVSVFRSADEPMSIAILVDTSGSMQMPDVQEIGRPKPIWGAIARFIELGNTRNEYFLASFDERYRELHGWSSGNVLLASKPEINPEKKGTALYDACLAALAKLETGRYEKRVMLLFSDGIDATSKNKYSELIRVLRKQDVLVYAVGPRQIFGGPFTPFKIVMKEGEKFLAGLTSLTGGMGFVPENKKEFERVVEQIAIELRHQYRLGFSAAQLLPANKPRRLKLKITLPPDTPPNFSKLTIRNRQTYIPRG